MFPMRENTYHGDMSRGWESKNVEEQVLEKQSESASGKRNPEIKRKIAAASAVVEREKQSLMLQRERILSERTASPHRRAALTAALADVELKLESLGCSPVAV